MKIVYKALLLPINQAGQLLLQDRRGYKYPDWGFFGGGVEAGETPLQAVIREAKEELNVDISPAELEYQGELPGSVKNNQINKCHVYVWKFDQSRIKLTLLEGTGMEFLSIDQAIKKITMTEDKSIIQTCFSDE